MLTEILLSKKRETQEMIRVLSSSMLTLILSRTAMGQRMCTKAAAPSTSQLQLTLLSVLSWLMKKHGLVFISLLYKYLLFISGE